MRAFLAIALPKNIKDYIGEIQQELKNAGADVRWTTPENLHLTLKFLGEINEKQEREINAILDGISGAWKDFTITLGGLGAFPHAASPRIIWIGLDEGVQETTRLAEELEEKTDALGIPKETKPFSAHLTIGRVKSNLNLVTLTRQLRDLQNIPPRQTLQFKAAAVLLVKSTLTPHGPLYENLKTASLRNT